MNFERPQHDPSELDLDLSWALAVLQRARAQIATFVLIALGVAGVTIIVTPPVYTASAVLLLETQPPGLFRSNSVFSDKIDPPMVDTQVEVLRSSQIILRVIDELKLLESPEFKDETIRIPGPIEFLRLSQQWVLATLEQSFAEPGENPITQNNDDPRREILSRLLRNLEIARVGSSNTIQISYTGPNPVTAATLVNRLALIYITTQLAWQPLSTDNGNAQVEDRVLITKASPPPFPSGPRKALIMAGALLAGLFTGLATAFAREWLDETLQSPEQIERITATRCLAILPRTTRPVPQASRQPQLKHFNSSDYPLISDVLAHPICPFSDGIRRIAVSLRNSHTTKAARIVAITSVARGEGKTTIAASLALLLAQTQGPTLLIDADLRERGATRLLAPEASIGLRDGVSGKCPLANLLWTDTETPLQFLPTIPTGLPEHPADILGTPNMDQFLRQAGKTFRNIVIDLPALGSVIDAQALFPSLDSLLLVIAKGAAARDLSAALEAAPAIRKKLNGTILNMA